MEELSYAEKVQIRHGANGRILRTTLEDLVEAEESSKKAKMKLERQIDLCEAMKGLGVPEEIYQQQEEYTSELVQVASTKCKQVQHLETLVKKRKSDLSASLREWNSLKVGSFCSQDDLEVRSYLQGAALEIRSEKLQKDSETKENQSLETRIKNLRK